MLPSLLLAALPSVCVFEGGRYDTLSACAQAAMQGMRARGPGFVSVRLEPQGAAAPAAARRGRWIGGFEVQSPRALSGYAARACTCVRQGSWATGALTR